MQPWEFYAAHLERVSRSFSFCIAQLPTPQREWIALAYLLFRVADTIEDSAWQSQAKQFQQFDCFNDALNGIGSLKALESWADDFPLSIVKEERLLLIDAPLLLDDLFLLPDKIRKQLVKNVQQMMAGMRHFLSHHSSQGELSFSHTSQLNQYCFFVAGLVGELLTFIFVDALEHMKMDDACLLDGFHFGLFLQKINVLKDQLSDEALGRKFVPSRVLLRQSVFEHATHAFAYIKRLPANEAREFRLFCAWSLFIGLASLKWIDKRYATNKAFKISYSETMSIVFKLKKIIDDNEALDLFFEKHSAALEACSDEEENKKGEGCLPLWFQEIYPSELLQKHASELGLLE
tara:strand:- start:739 stop:1782 length:1044 start_codon:yes stop_codon:yes gene_type:complete